MGTLSASRATFETTEDRLTFLINIPSHTGFGDMIVAKDDSEKTTEKILTQLSPPKKISPIFGVVPEETILQAADNQRSVC